MGQQTVKIPDGNQRFPMSNGIKFVFFGGEPLAIPTLEQLREVDLLPSLVVAGPDRPSGRGRKLTPPPAKVWAEAHNIPVFQPESLKNPEALTPLLSREWDVFVVVAYNAILPKSLLEHPRYGTLNVHPSLLPFLRGPSPIRSAILKDMSTTGVSIMQMDAEMDHGPIVVQEEVTIPKEKWPMRGVELDALLSERGGALLAKTIPKWVAGECGPEEQDHDRATYTQKFSKADGLINLDDDPYQNLLKIRAFDGFPGTYFFIEKDGKQIRIKITDAEIAPDGSLKILRVIPEGKKEMDYVTFCSQT